MEGTAFYKRRLGYDNLEYVSLWAGGEVESRINPEYLKNGMYDDIDQIKKLELSKEQEEWASSECRKIIEESWPAIHIIAKELLLKNTLSGAEIKSICEKHIKRENGHYWRLYQENE